MEQVVNPAVVVTVHPFRLRNIANCFGFAASEANRKSVDEGHLISVGDLCAAVTLANLANVDVADLDA